MFDTILESAQQYKKNILIIGGARSGTHAVGAEFSKRSNVRYLAEICKVSDDPEPWLQIQQTYDTTLLTVAQIVQLTPKIYLAGQIHQIKQHNIIVCLRRKDKIKQFASWVYFRLRDPTEFLGWHNHTADKTNLQPGSIEARHEDIIQFMLEQLVDDFFLPDFNLVYEDLEFTQTRYHKNSFAFPIENIFSNLDFVKQHLADWEYHNNHLRFDSST